MPEDSDARTRVLVVEDDSWIRTFLLDVLADAGYTTIEAADGRTGLRLAEQDHPDLVLLDLAMPEFTGNDVLAELQRNPHTHGIPVLVLSAYGNFLDLRQTGSVAGVLSKPLDMTKLLDAIKNALSSSGATDTP